MQKSNIDIYILKVFDTEEGKIVLNYYKELYGKTKTITDINNVNNTFFNLGRLGAIEQIENDINYIINGNTNAKKK